MVWTSCSSLLYHKEEDFICLFVFVCLDSKLSTLFFLKLFWANKQTSLSWQDFVYSCQTHSLISWIHFYCLHFIKLPWKKNIAVDHEANSSALCSCWLLSLPSPQYHQKWALPSQDVGASTGRSSPFPVACMLISRGFCHIDFSQEKEPFLTPPRLQLSPLYLVSSSWLNVMLAVPSSEVTVPFSGIPLSWYSMFEVL